MEHRSQKTKLRIVSLAVALSLAATARSQDLRFDVRHERALKDRLGRVTLDDRGVRYEQVLNVKQQSRVAKGKKPPELERARWDYRDIQQLWISPEKLVILTYTDRKWLLGADREFEFDLTGKGQSFTAAYEFLKGKLDQRFVAAMPDPAIDVVWEMPVKLLGTLRGSEGVLQAGADRIVYKTDRKAQSRTWRYRDVENAATSGPFQLTLTTYERAGTHYSSLKGFNFQLKEALDEKRFDFLWRRINQAKGLEFLTSIQERENHR